MERHHKSGSSQPIPPVVITISPPQHNQSSRHPNPAFLSMRIRDQGGGVPEANLSQIFSYSFTTAGRTSGVYDSDEDSGGGPYAAQHVGGSASVDAHSGSMGGASLFGDIVGRGVQVGMGTIAGLGYGLPMSRLYAKYDHCLFPTSPTRSHCFCIGISVDLWTLCLWMVGGVMFLSNFVLWMMPRTSRSVVRVIRRRMCRRNSMIEN